MAPKPKKSARVKPNKTQSISLRRGTVRVEDANLLQDVCLGQSLDTIPDQIRSALYQRRVRIIGVFKHVDDDFTGRISMFEFVKGMQELGLDASPEHIGAVFHSMDDENSGSIEYGDFHNLLVRSVQSHPRLNPVEPNIVQNYGLRTDPIRKENANILSGVELGYGQEGPEGTDAETIPGLIRAALQERLVRVIDIFRQIDEDGSGSVTMREFVKSLYTMGLEAPIEAVGALFKSIDVNDRGVITYSKLHELLVRSFQTHPVLEPLDLHAMNAIGLRTKQISVADANLLQDLKLDDESLDSIPHQIRVALYKNKVRVIDIFRQMDDDASGLIDLPEFKKAMEEFGWRPHDDALNYVFSTFDCDASGSITYLELDRLLHASCETYPRLYQRRGAVVNQEEAIRQMLAQRAQRAHMQEAYASVSRPQTAASRPQTATSRPPTAMERPQTAATMPSAMRKRPTWANLGTSIKTLVAAEKSKLRPVVFTPTQITTRSGAELEAYELMNVPVEGANRGSDKLAIVTHPITGAGGASDGSKLDKLNRLALHAHLHHEGFSILAYEAHPLAVGGVQTGELQEEYLLAAMEYAASHRSFKYCKIALMAQGVGAAAAFLAISKNPELFEGRVRVLSACQPAHLEDTTMAELLTTHVPRCTVPTLLSHAEAGMQHISTINHDYMTAQQIHDALEESIPKQLFEVKGYPLFGKARRFDGAKYFGDHAEKLSFITELSTARKKRIAIPHF